MNRKTPRLSVVGYEVCEAFSCSFQSPFFTATGGVAGDARVDWDSIFSVLLLATSGFCATRYNE
jgi:hypothetical protein